MSSSTNLEIYDTTLRDGSQQEGISLSVADKLRIASLLAELGVDYIEGGWPGALPKDDIFFQRAQSELDLGESTLVAFGSTRKPQNSVGDDIQLKALLAADTEVVCIVGKSWDYHITEALRTNLDEGIRMAAESVEFLRSHDRRVFFDAEHFFDGYRTNPEFSLAVARAVVEAGAERLILCDTNGGTLPHQIAPIVDTIDSSISDVSIGVHFHNDAGCAVASSMEAVRAGVRQVQGCINGYGERTGNADLCSIIPNLVLKLDIPVLDSEQLAQLAPISHHVAEVVNLVPDTHRPYVGVSAFTHKAGLHTSALARKSDAYEHVPAAVVGNHTRMVVSEQAGRAAIKKKAEELGLEIDDKIAVQALERVKQLEQSGYHFEAADGSLELLIRKLQGWESPFFRLDSFRVFVERLDGGVSAEATVKLYIGEERVVTTGEGDGPVHALDQALRAALINAYPEVSQLRLTDYRVRVLDSEAGTGATVRVLLETSSSSDSWGTLGVHDNIIEASWEALSDGVVIGLLHLGATPPHQADNPS